MVKPIMSSGVPFRFHLLFSFGGAGFGDDDDEDEKEDVEWRWCDDDVGLACAAVR